jgi:ribosomal protein S18 acetylase RimI-like enzyme
LISNNEIKYITGDETIIDDVGELWGELNRVHFEKALDFKHHYESFTFCDRKRLLLSHANRGKMFVVVACHNDAKVGYCISSVTDGVGEIDSIYIKPDYRGNRIGDKLVEKALAWIALNNARKCIVKVVIGNEDVFGFYSKYGFKPRLTELELL